jgi:hypothetical protein
MFLLPHLLSDQLHTRTAPSMQFHTKLKRFQQLAFMLVTISEILSKRGSLKWVSNLKHYNTHFRNCRFNNNNCRIMVANNKCRPYNRTGNVTHCLYIANYILTTKCKIWYAYPGNMDNTYIYKPRVTLP